MNRQRIALLIAIIVLFVGISSWIVYSAYRKSQTHFMTGAPPEDVRDLILPKEADLASMHPPAISVDEPMRFGSVTSVATVVEYGDYQCDNCKEFAKTVNTVIPAYKGRVRFVWKDFPIQEMHPESFKAALFARCAGLQGKYWEAHDALLSAESLNESVFSILAQRLGLDSKVFYTCLDDKKMQEALTKDIEIARGEGISSTPFVFVGTKASTGALSQELLLQQINLFIGK